jgi:thiol-disulfide isomerase/thioredoxin
MTRAERWLALGLVALGAAVAGAYLYDKTVKTQRSFAKPLASGTVAAAPRAIPSLRPNFTLTGLDGQRHSVNEWDGHPMLVNFWATWCEPCRREMPLFGRLQREGEPRGLVIIGIAIDAKDAVERYLKEQPVDYPILIGEQDAIDVAAAFGVEALVFPFTVVIDGKGEILSVHMGEMHEGEARTTLSVLSRLDRGELAPDQARGALAAALKALPPAAPR